MVALTILLVVAIALLVFLTYKEFTRVPDVEEKEEVEIQWTQAGKLRPGDNLLKR